MAAATGRFVSFSVVHVDLGGLDLGGMPPGFACPPPARAVSRPHRIDPPRARLRQSEDWSDIESLLTAGIAVPESVSGRSRHRALPLLVSSALGTAVFAGLAVAAYLAVGCGSTTAGCAVRTAAKAPVPDRQTASSPAPTTSSPAAPTVRVAAQPEPDVSQPVVQGRSVGEDDATRAETPAADDAPAASEPRRHRRHHRHRWW